MLRSIFQKGPEFKSAREFAMMREAGKIVAEAVRLCRDMAKPGVRTQDINTGVAAVYSRHGAQPLFKGYPGPKVPFPAETCISINEQVVHGIPGPRELRDGDILKIDTACKRQGWCADAAVSIPVGEVRPERKRLIEVGNQLLKIAMTELARRRWWSEVAWQLQQHAQKSGFSVVEQYVGHGIGRIMHEAPQVPNYVSKDLRKHDFRLQEGLALAVEPMVNMGRPEVRVLADHWTVVTKDGLPSVHCEHTVAITRNGIQVLTADEEMMITG